jgi:hypothetical protein
MIMHAFKDYHFLELQDENGDIVGYTAIELFDHLMEQYVQAEDVAEDQVTALHKILERMKNHRCIKNLSKMPGGTHWSH